MLISVICKLCASFIPVANLKLWKTINDINLNSFQIAQKTLVRLWKPRNIGIFAKLRHKKRNLFFFTFLALNLRTFKGYFDIFKFSDIFIGLFFLHFIIISFSFFCRVISWIFDWKVVLRLWLVVFLTVQLWFSRFCRKNKFFVCSLMIIDLKGHQ